MTKKLLVLLLCLAMLVSITACTPQDTTSETPSADGGSTESSEVSDDGNPKFPFEAKKYDTTIRILCVAQERHTYGELQFVPDEDSSFGQISDAVAARNDIIEEKYGIKFEVVPSTTPQTELELAMKSASGSDMPFELVSNTVCTMLPYATENYFLPLNDVLHLENEWWDQNAIETLAVTDDIYFVAGDCMVTDDEYCYCILYNKDIYEQNQEIKAQFGDLYQLVDDGKWIYDALYTMAKAVTQPDENGKLGTVNCTYGLLSDGYSTEMIVLGSGSTTARKIGKGNFEISIGERTAVDAFGKVFEICTDTGATILVDKVPESWEGIANMFISGRGLFKTSVVQSISDIKSDTAEKKVNFGVLPMPKYTVEQENYYSGINVYQTEVMAIPSFNNKGATLEATACALEALGYYSRYSAGESVSHAYYETTLKSQAMPDEEDERMLDMVVSNRLYDIGTIYNWGDIIQVWASIIRSGNNTLSSQLDSVKTKAETAMNETIDKYNTMG